MGSQNLHPQILSTTDEKEISFSHLCRAMEPCPDMWWWWFCCPERYQAKAGQWFSRVVGGRSGWWSPHFFQNKGVCPFYVTFLARLSCLPVPPCDSLCPDGGWESTKSTNEGLGSSYSVISKLHDSWLLSWGFWVFFWSEQKKILHLVSSFL